MNLLLAAAADAAVQRDDTEGRPGFCSRFARQAAHIAYGEKYEHLFGANARETYANFAAAGFAVDASRGTVPGDLVFKLSKSAGIHGHVGIRVLQNRIAENASTTRGRIKGAKGYRSIERFGKITHVVRLPE